MSSDSIRDFLLGGLAAPDAGVGRAQGNLAEGFARAGRRVAADYAVPFLAHATLEPQNCTAHVTGDRAEIWVPTQNGEAAMASAAHALGIRPQDVIVHKTMLGGGFGRRGATQDFVPPAVLIARRSAGRSRCCGRARKTPATTTTARWRWRGWRPVSTRMACRSPGMCA